ncbi:hypothetical protein DMA11_06695 [Marinilabiliaceae bacterium JC017]|nr:hypothetical protein DMA11_06695 [Marinilabiliaceae bacterium JC017]
MDQIEPRESTNVLAVAGLALSILAFIIALIPCFGFIALLPAVLGLIFGIIGLSHANRYYTPKAIAIVAVILSVTALVLGGIWTGVVSTFSKRFEYRLEEKIEKGLDEIGEELKEKEIEIRLKRPVLTEEEKDRIREEAQKAGDVAEKIVSEMLEGIRTIKIESTDKKIVIHIPEEALSEEDLQELKEDIKDIQEELRELFEEFSIRIEIEEEDE